jgi:hypothetical protein
MRIRLLVREQAEKQGRNRTWLSRHAEVQYDTVSGIWHNPYRHVDLLTMVKLAKALNVKVAELFVIEQDE